MAYLLTTTFIWAFSFSLIGHYLSPVIDSWSLSFFRTLIALLVFIPFIDFKISRKHILFMILIGAIQIGIMYLMYLNAFKFTSVSKILLFTITTPLYVTFIADLIEKKFRSFFLMLSIASIVGASFLRFNSPAQNDLIGFFLIQGANFCFALGQVLYKFFEKWTGRIPNGMSDFAYFYIGALIFTTVGFLSSDVKTPLPNDIATWLLIVWMGVGASGLGFYFWDKGSLFVSSGTLAVMNNLVIPLGLMVEILFFGQALNSETYLIGTLIIVVSILVSLRK
ncbi:MAG: EamA family transporter [bacterium TMED144]|nr:MAG: EamA family transporter [bacterium TMED144]|tara:strand:- start:2345 stop:3184 length:840 start_codon:yes stop_codon:yes gene_type:complete